MMKKNSFIANKDWIEFNDLKCIEKNFYMGSGIASLYRKKYYPKNLILRGDTMKHISYFPFILSYADKIYISGKKYTFIKKMKIH